jgi:citrate synthase
MRHLTSSGVDVYTSLAGAAGALYGPRHGGANEAVLRMLQKIGSVSEVPSFIEKVKAKKVRLMGFGHRVYKNYDPRARIVRRIAEEVFSILGKEPLVEVAMALEKVALEDQYFIQRKLYPNVDFYSGLIYKAMVETIHIYIHSKYILLTFITYIFYISLLIFISRVFLQISLLYYF